MLFREIIAILIIRNEQVRSVSKMQNYFDVVAVSTPSNHRLIGLSLIQLSKQEETMVLDPGPT
jgi:hypothetical protein